MVDGPFQPGCCGSAITTAGIPGRTPGFGSGISGRFLKSLAEMAVEIGGAITAAVLEASLAGSIFQTAGGRLVLIIANTLLIDRAA